MKRLSTALSYSFTLLLAVGLLVWTPNSLAEADIEKAKFLASFDQWSSAEGNGTVRLLVVPAPEDPKRSLVYLQWVGETKDNDNGQIVETVDVTEINDRTNALVLGVGASRTNQGPVISLQLQDGSDGPKEAVLIRSGIPGKYTLIKAEQAGAQLADAKSDEYFEWLLDFYWPTF